MRIVQEESPGNDYEIVEWCIHVVGYYDSSILGDRRVRRIQKKQEGRRAIGYSYTFIYCPTEEDARQLSARITPESKVNPVWLEKSKLISGPQCY